MKLSGYRSLPIQGHLNNTQRVIGYLFGMKHAVIWFCISLLNYSDIQYKKNDWKNSVYGDVNELMPTNAPESLEAPIILTHYVDANLYHYMLTGRSITGIINFINKTPIDLFSKKNNTGKIATYGSEFLAVCICVEQIIDLRTALRYLGFPIIWNSYVFGDNE